MITAETRETIIITLLQQLDTVHPQAMTARMLAIPVNQSGLGPVTEKDISSMLEDLRDKGWVCHADSQAAPEVLRYKRTEDGRAFLRRNGF